MIGSGETTQNAKKRGAVLAALVLFACPGFAQAGEVTSEDALLTGARQCTQHMPLQETKYGIPRHLLMAIGSNESGRYHKGINAVVPWPWTINAAGKGYYFETKAEAISAVQKLRAQGIESIDVGCMQVNLKHHAHAFGDLQQAFDPATNVGYAARFLRENYDATQSWMKATAFYHSQTPKFGNPYMQAVYNRWKGVLSRIGSTPSQALAVAGLTGPHNAQEVATLEMASLNVTSDARPNRPYGARSTIDATKPLKAERKPDAAPKMKIIRVYSRDEQPADTGFSNARDHGVNVVRTENAFYTGATADMSQSERASVRAVSTRIVQDMVAASAIGMANQGTPARGQFAPAVARISSAMDEGFVIRN